MNSSRRRLITASAMTAGALGFRGLFANSLCATDDRAGRVPVILATDIGGDIDDTWALALLLKCPELDLKLAVTDYGYPSYRGKILARFLQTAGHAHIPVGLGPEYDDCSKRNDAAEGRQAAWVQGYDLNRYPGTVHKDGAKAIVDVIMRSTRPVTLISIAPAPTVASALSMEPKIGGRARFVGMFGSVRVGYDGSPTPAAEGNVVRAINAAQQVLVAPWDVTITPLDTCGLVTLDGERYQRLLKSNDPIVSALIENYRIWSRLTEKYAHSADTSSSVLFDLVAVYLAMSQDLCAMERLDIRITDDGYTKIDPTGKSMNVATAWKNLDAFKDFLVNRLLS